MIELIVLGIACGVISLTVTRGDIFQGIRDFLFYRTERQRIGKIYKFFYGLLSCPYCFSHWVAFFMAWFWKPILVESEWVVMDLTISSFVIVGISSITWACIQRLQD